MATGDEQFEEAQGIVNDLNQDFSVSKPYQGGTIFLLLNGGFIPSDDDEGLEETNPATGEFRLKSPPQDGSQPDRILVRYIEA